MKNEAIDKGHAAWIDAFKSNDAKALGLLVAADVVCMPPHREAVTGPQGVIDWFAGVVKVARTVAVGISSREVIVTGDFAIERGAFTWKVAPASGGPHVEDRGNFMAVWQKQRDGSWKIKRNIWNSTLPLPATR